MHFNISLDIVLQSRTMSTPTTLCLISAVLVLISTGYALTPAESCAYGAMGPGGVCREHALAISRAYASNGNAPCPLSMAMLQCIFEHGKNKCGGLTELQMLGATGPGLKPTNLRERNDEECNELADYVEQLGHS